MSRLVSFCLVSLALAIVTLATWTPMARAGGLPPVVQSYMDIDIAQMTVKTNDTQNINIHDYTLVTQQVNKTISNGTTNRTVTVNQTTLFASPGPIIVDMFTAHGSLVIGPSGRYNLTLGYYTLSFPITPNFGFDTIRVQIYDQALNRTRIVTFYTVYSEEYKAYLDQKQRDANNATFWYDFTAQSSFQNAMFWLQSFAELLAGVIIILVAQHKLARALAQDSWVDKVKRAIPLTMHHDPTSNAIDPKGFTPDVNLEERLKVVQSSRRGLMTILRQDLHMLEQVKLADAEETKLKGMIRRIRESAKLPPDRDRGGEVLQIGHPEGILEETKPALPAGNPEEAAHA